AVLRHVEAGARARAGHAPRGAARLPEPGEQDVRVRRVDADVRRAGVRVLLENLLPGPATVFRPVDYALWVGTEGVPEHRGEGDVGVSRVHRHRADLSHLLPDVRPGLARVGGLVDDVA